MQHGPGASHTCACPPHPHPHHHPHHHHTHTPLPHTHTHTHTHTYPPTHQQRHFRFFGHPSLGPQPRRRPCSPLLVCRSPFMKLVSYSRVHSAAGGESTKPLTMPGSERISNPVPFCSRHGRRCAAFCSWLQRAGSWGAGSTIARAGRGQQERLAGHPRLEEAAAWGVGEALPAVACAGGPGPRVAEVVQRAGLAAVVRGGGGHSGVCPLGCMAEGGWGGHRHHNERWRPGGSTWRPDPAGCSPPCPLPPPPPCGTSATHWSRARCRRRRSRCRSRWRGSRWRRRRLTTCRRRSRRRSRRTLACTGSTRGRSTCREGGGGGAGNFSMSAHACSHVRLAGKVLCRVQQQRMFAAHPCTHVAAAVSESLTK
jgi:hypothetical protein